MIYFRNLKNKLIEVPLACSTINGTALNPFLVFAGSLMTTYTYDHQWVYYIAPLIGIIVGGMFHKAHNITSLLSDNFENVIVLNDDMANAKLSQTRRNSKALF